MRDFTIDRLGDVTDDDLEQLADLLLDAVDSGAGVSFMGDLDRARALEWWRATLDARSPRGALLVARDGQGIAGSVQLKPAWEPNQPHRADVAKMIVHRRARGRGIARALMQELERQATAHGITLLLLDTVRDSPAQRLYESLGWIRVGIVPDFALNPDGRLADTVFYYRKLG